MVRFSYDPAVLAAFPTIRAGVILARGVINGPAPAELAAEYEEEQRATIERIGSTPLSQLPSLSAWRRAFSRFGVSPTQYRSAAEALLRRLTKRGSIPSINLLVDLANLVSIRHRLPVAVFDQATATGATVVRFAEGRERFTDLGTREPSPPVAGEVIFVDEAELVSARRWCWRQSLESAAGPGTSEVLVTVEGHHAGAAGAAEAATDDLISLLERFASPQFVDAAQLSPDSPGFRPL